MYTLHVRLLIKHRLCRNKGLKSGMHTLYTSLFFDTFITIELNIVTRPSYTSLFFWHICNNKIKNEDVHIVYIQDYLCMRKIPIKYRGTYALHILVQPAQRKWQTRGQCQGCPRADTYILHVQPSWSFKPSIQALVPSPPYK